MLAEHSSIEPLYELHRLKVSRAAVFIRQPFALLASVIEIKHICYRINAESVNMVLLKPEQRVGNQKALHLGASVIEIRRTPALVFGKLRIIRLIKIRSVKMPESLIIIAEMAGHPVHYDAYSLPVRAVHEIFEILGSSVSACHREITRCLIPPGAVVGMLAERHELQMGVMHLHCVINKLLSQLSVAEIIIIRRTAP